MSRRAGPCLPPTATIWPPEIATSPLNAGLPLPSMTLPPRMTMSCMGRLLMFEAIMPAGGSLDNAPPRMSDSRSRESRHGQAIDRDARGRRGDADAEPAGPAQRAVDTDHGRAAR